MAITVGTSPKRPAVINPEWWVDFPVDDRRWSRVRIFEGRTTPINRTIERNWGWFIRLKHIEAKRQAVRGVSICVRVRIYVRRMMS